MELKDRKLIANRALPSFNLGTEAAMATVNSKDAFGLLSGGNVAQFDQTANLKLENSMLKSGQFTPTKDGKLEAKVYAQGGKTGAFLKNNVGNVANAAMSAINFASTIGGLSKNTMSSDEMMGSGGTTQQSANGIGYTESRVDDAGILKQIDATASAATMTGALSGAALGGSIGTIFGPLGTGIGTLAGGLLGGVAGLFGGKKAKEEAERQKRIAINRTNAANALNREQAYTIGLRNEFNRENRTDTSLSLFHAKDGTERYELNPFNGETLDWYKINTSHGPMFGPANAQTKRKERIISDDGWSYKVKNGKHDDGLTYLKPGDAVISAEDYMINPSTGNKIIDDADAIAKANGGFIGRKDKNWLEMNLNIARMMVLVGKRKPKDNSGYIGGTLNRFSTGGEDYGMPLTQRWNNSAADLAGMYSTGMYSGIPQTREEDEIMLPEVTITPTVKTISATTSSPGTSNTPKRSAGKLFGTIGNAIKGLDFGNILTAANEFTTAAQRNAIAEGLRAPKSFVANQYEQDALQQLNSLHSDYYPVWAQNREAEGSGKSSIAQSGGLSAGQKMLGYMGLANRTQQNNAAALFEHQGRENALRAQAANAALQAGNQSATRQQQAYQWDEDMLAKAHAARLNMWETSAYDRQNALTLYFKNRWEKNQFDRTMNLYESQQKDDHAKTQAIINSLGTKNTPVTLTGVEGNASMVTIDPTTGKFVRTNPFSASQLLSENAKKSIDSLNNIASAATNAINGANTGAAPKITQLKVSKPSSKKNTTRKKITLTKDSMGQQFANVVTKPLKKESKKATIQAKPTEDTTTKSTLLSSILPGGRNLVSLSSNEDIPSYSVAKQEEHKLKSKVGKSNASSFAEKVSETVSKAYEEGQKKRKSQLKKQPAKQESIAGKSNASSFFDALSKLYAEGLKKRKETLKEQRGY